MAFGGAATLAVAFGGARWAVAGEPCARVEASAELPPAWAEAVRELERELARLPSADCRRVTLSVDPLPAGVQVVARASDGRRAARTVHQPDALVSTALGLVVTIPEAPADAVPPPVPPAATPAVTTAPVTPAAPPTTPAPAQAPPAPRASAPAIVVTSPRTVSAWLGLSGGGRVGEPASITMADVEARFDLLLGNWLLMATFRDAPFGLSRGTDEDAYQEIDVGLGVGRHVPLGTSALDVAVAPSLVAMRLEDDITDASGRTHDVVASDVEFRIGASVRLALPLARAWRLTLTLDSDLAPGLLTSSVHVDPLPDAVPFPVWTTGLRIGASTELL
jgi:hypothetical protein